MLLKNILLGLGGVGVVGGTGLGIYYGVNEKNEEKSKVIQNKDSKEELQEDTEGKSGISDITDNSGTEVINKTQSSVTSSEKSSSNTPQT